MLYQVLVTICDLCVNFLMLATLKLVKALMSYFCELARLAASVEKVYLVWRSNLLS